MTVLASLALQAAVFARLSSDAGVTAALDGAVFDAVPAGPLPETYAVLGVEDVRVRGDSSGRVVEHVLTVTVHGAASGFAAAKAAAAAIGAALDGVALPLDAGDLCGLSLRRVRANRAGGGTARRIDLRFRAVLDHS